MFALQPCLPCLTRLSCCLQRPDRNRVRKNRRHSRRVALAALVLGLTQIGSPPLSRASGVDIYGWGGRATAMGGAFTAVADDFTAVYYNPAGLMYQRSLEEPCPNRKGIKFDFGYTYGEPRFYVEDPKTGRHQKDYGSSTGPYLGITFDPVDFHGTFSRKVFACGLGLYLPVDHLAYYGRYWPEERVHPFFYDYTMRFVFMPAMAWEILPRLSLGAGLRILARMQTDTVGTIDVSIQKLLSGEALFLRRISLDRNEVHLGELEDLGLNLAPVVGLRFRASDQLGFGLVYRGENHINDFGVTDPVINLGNLLSFPQGYQFRFVRFFTPHQFFCGMAWRPVPEIMVSMDLGWFDWSDFRDVEARRPDPPFQDTWMPRLGVEYSWQESLVWRAGYFFYDSPVPDQTGESNFLDNNRHVFSAGAELIIRDPPGFWDKPVHVNLHLQYHYATTRHYEKNDPGDPYYPGYSFGGYIFAGGVQISIPL